MIRCNLHMLDRLLDELPAGVDVDVEYRGYGIHEASGRLDGVGYVHGRRRMFLEGDQRHEVSVRAIDNIRFSTTDSAELADLLCRSLPHLTSVVLETRAEGPVVGTHFGVSDEAGAVVCLDSHGQEHRIALGDVLSLRVECP